MAKTMLDHRQKNRIVSALAEPMNWAQLCDKLYMSETSVRRFLKKLLAEEPRRIYISDWVEGPNKPTPVYKAGAGGDKPYVIKRERRTVDPRIVEAQRIRAEVLELLTLPQTVDQIAARLDLSRNRVVDIMREHKDAGRIYIKGWLLPVWRGSQAPVYALGNLPDKPRERRTRQKLTYRCNRPAKSAWASSLGL